MDGCNQSPKHDKHRSKPLEGPSFEVSDYAGQACIQVFSADNEFARKKSNSKSSEILSTPELISAVGQIWNCANDSLAHFKPTRNVKHTDDVSQTGDVFWRLGGKEDSNKSDPASMSYAVNDSEFRACSTCLPQQSLQSTWATQKRHYEPCANNFLNSFLGRNLHNISILDGDFLKEKGLTSFEISYDLRKIYGWMSRISLSRPTLPVTTTHENEKTVECCGSTDVTTACEIVQADETSIQSDGLRAGTADFFDVTKSKELSFTKCLEFFRDKSAFVNHATITSSGCIDKQHKYETYNDESSDNKVDGYGKLETEGEPIIKIHSQKVNQKSFFHGKQEHAASGALAGVFVSLCLHPVDTIKTVFQSRRADQKSIFSIGQSIISERGLMGLYRGIASNIATAAPISAIYTFTYETVKGSLLPLLPKEYHSFAHCTAGGCASIATSFIFTPSERIKQQMQVSSQYQNCWSAIVKIIGGGGLPSLYAGWGAVLCRNIPHSIIKFYTYESVKQLILSSQHPNTQPNTVQTLLCGGLAGSTAALFSTPFDVVKTRLQTQVPGSASRYHSVISALREISTQEGFKGLYRGLTPRLVMYMSQGALFFSSYEFFKSLFSLETLHQSCQITDYERETDDISMFLSLLSS